MPKKIGNVELHMGPHGAPGGPDDLQKVIVDFIRGAKKKLDIAVQELDSRPIADAVIEARQRRVRVRLVLEASYLTESRGRADPRVPGGSHEINRVLHDEILRSAIHVRSDFNPNIFHQKFIIRDGSAVLTGSTNFTETGVEKNLNHVVVVRDRKVANIYTKEFNEIQQGHFGKLNEGHDDVPRDVTVSKLPIRVLFAPDHSPEMEIMKQMLKAQERIDFAVFTFSQSSGIDDAMIALRNAGVEVRGALDGAQGNQTWAATRPVHNAGAELFLVPKGDGVGKLHHKLMVIDRQVIIAGSFNYTGPANRLNDENVLVIGDLETTSATSRNAQRRLAGYALEEIDRIIDRFGRAIP